MGTPWYLATLTFVLCGLVWCILVVIVFLMILALTEFWNRRGSSARQQRVESDSDEN